MERFIQEIKMKKKKTIKVRGNWNLKGTKLSTLKCSLICRILFKN